MKPTLFLLTFCLGLWSCNRENQANRKSSLIDTPKADVVTKENTNVYIKDKSKYSSTFINGLSEYSEPIKIIDNFIVVGKDTTYFPDQLPLKGRMSFKATKVNQYFLLSIERVNQTDLEYDFEIIENNETVDSKIGRGTLHSMFFLASEVDEDSETGDSYGSSEYWDNSNNCSLSIRVGTEKDDNGQLRATINYKCSDKTGKTFNLEDCPTLRTE